MRHARGARLGSSLARRNVSQEAIKCDGWVVMRQSSETGNITVYYCDRSGGQINGKVGAERTFTPKEVNEIVKAEMLRVSMLKARMIQAQPFWGLVLAQMKIEPLLKNGRDWLKTYGATNCVDKIFINPLLTHPSVPYGLNNSQMGFLLAHEVGHVCNATMARREDRNPLLWNQATDYFINSEVVRVVDTTWDGTARQAYMMIEGGCLDEKFRGLSSDQIYVELEKKQKEEDKRGSEGGEKGKKGDKQEEGEGAKSSTVQTPDGTFTDFPGGVDSHLNEPLTEEQKKEIKEKVKQAARQAVKMRGEGAVPDAFSHLLGDEPSKPLPWYVLFRRYLEATLAKSEYDPRRMAKRYAAGGFSVAGLAGEEVPLVVIAIDTSGSVSDTAILRAVKEVKDICQNSADVKLILHTDYVGNVYDGVSAVEEWMRNRGRHHGGTAHRPVFEYIRKKQWEPAVFVGITDMDSDINDLPIPRYPVIWVADMKDLGGQTPRKPKFGTMFVVK